LAVLALFQSSCAELHAQRVAAVSSTKVTRDRFMTVAPSAFLVVDTLHYVA
jgi:hypothetical protein